MKKVNEFNFLDNIVANYKKGSNDRTIIEVQFEENEKPILEFTIASRNADDIENVIVIVDDVEVKPTFNYIAPTNAIATIELQNDNKRHVVNIKAVDIKNVVRFEKNRCIRKLRKVQNLLLLERMFKNSIALEEIHPDAFTAAVDSRELFAMFQNCTSLTSLPEGLFDISDNIYNVTAIFLNCTSLVDIASDLHICFNERNVKGRSTAFQTNDDRKKLYDKHFLKNLDKMMIR